MGNGGWSIALRRALLLLVLVAVGVFQGCGGGHDEPVPQATAASADGAPLPRLLAETGDVVITPGSAASFEVDALNVETYQWQVRTGREPWRDIAGERGNTLALADMGPQDSGSEYRVRASGAGGALTSAPMSLTVALPQAPAIDAQPADLRIASGEDAHFELKADASARRFQWQMALGTQAWQDLDGATEARLSLPAAGLASGSRYRALVHGDSGTRISETASLAVALAAVAPTIETQPLPVTVSVGQNATFEVVVSNQTTSPSYLWQTRIAQGSWSSIPGTNSPSYTFLGTTKADDGRQFRVLVSNSAGKLHSAVAELTVVDATAAPTINAQPQSLTISAGRDARFSVTASGRNLRYQWQLNPPGAAGWADIGGAREAGLKVNNVKESDSGERYRVIVSNRGGPVTSRSAKLTVTEAMAKPTIDVQPKGSVRVVGDQAVLKVRASGAGTLSYRWQKASGSGGWNDVASGNRATLTFATRTLSDGGTYQVHVSNPGGSVSSRRVVLTVLYGESFTSDDTSNLNQYYDVGSGGSDSGGTAGGESGNAGVGAGYGKATNALMTLTRIADAEPVGEPRLTGAKVGLIRVRVGAGVAPVLVTLRGTSNSRYFDEGVASTDRTAKAMLSFGPEVSMHALVTSFKENIGVTPLTEAAYRYAINHYLVNKDDVISGAQPLLKTASLDDLKKLTKKQIETANNTILAEVKRHLPDLTSGLAAKDQLDSLVALPIPVDSSGSDAPMLNNRYGRAAVITGGLVTDAYGFNRSSGTPGLDFAEQIARDLTDGKIDGFALDGSPAAAPDAMHYNPARLPISLMVGANAVANRFGEKALQDKLPAVTEAVISRMGSVGVCQSIAYYFYESFLLRNNGKVRRFQTKYDNPDACGAALEIKEYTEPIVDVRQISSNSLGSFYVKTDGSVMAFGRDAGALLGANGKEPEPCGQGTDQTICKTDPPVVVKGLSQVSSVAAARRTALARTWSGQVLSWGEDSHGSLGRDPDADADCVSDFRVVCRSPKAIDLQVSVSDIYATSAEHLRTADSPPFARLDDTDTDTLFAVDADGQVYAWGFGGYGLRGDGLSGSDAEDSRRPTLIAGLAGVKGMAFTPTLAFALCRDGGVFAWGTNANGEFGGGDTQPKLSPTPVAVLEGEKVRQIAAGNNGILALLDDGKVLRWGTLKPNGSFRSEPIVDLELDRAGKVRHISSAGYFIMLDGRVLKFEANGVKLFDAGKSFKLKP